MLGIIRRMEWEQLPLMIPVKNGYVEVRKIELKRNNDLQGVLREIEESIGSNIDER